MIKEIIKDAIISNEVERYYRYYNWSTKELVKLVLTQDHIPMWKKIHYLEYLRSELKSSSSLYKTITRILDKITNAIESFKHHEKNSFYEIRLNYSSVTNIDNSELYGYIQCNTTFDNMLNTYLPRLKRKATSKYNADRDLFKNITIRKHNLLPNMKKYTTIYRIDLNGNIVSNWYDLGIFKLPKELVDITKFNPFGYGSVVQDLLTGNIGMIVDQPNLEVKSNLLLVSFFTISEFNVDKLHYDIDDVSPFTLIHKPIDTLTDSYYNDLVKIAKLYEDHDDIQTLLDKYNKIEGKKNVL